MPSAPNFRDVGLFVNTLAGKPLLQTGRLFRSGSIHKVPLAALSNPKTIINLCADPDAPLSGVRMKHVPTDDLPANYETIRPRTRGWLVEGLSALTADDLGLPVLVHSALGRDRCGIVVATALHLIGIPEQHIVDEYMASEGEVLPFKVLGALRGLMGFPQKLDPRIVPRLRASFAAK